MIADEESMCVVSFDGLVTFSTTELIGVYFKGITTMIVIVVGDRIIMQCDISDIRHMCVLIVLSCFAFLLALVAFRLRLRFH